MPPASATPREPDLSLSDYREVLLTNSAVYEALVRRAVRAHRDEKTTLALAQVERAANFAQHHHPGRFSDGAIENIAFAIGRRLRSEPAQTERTAAAPPTNDTRRRVLHVASRVYAIGGHTRMLRHWVDSDRRARHSLVLLNQASEPIPAWLQSSVEQGGGTTHQLHPGMSLEQRAVRLRNIAQNEADLVVLHQHPQDVVPTVAFAVSDCPPVVMLNHADHVFWLGSSVSDMVIDLRLAASAISTERRAARRTAVLPIPIAESARPPSREVARHLLGIPDNQLVLVSVGRSEKYRPCGPFNFVATAATLLHRHPLAHLYIVGASPDDLARYLRHPLHPRLHLVGNVEDPSNYRCAADIYVESFPFGSNTALLEAAECALPVVPACAPLFPLLVAANDSLCDVLANPRDEREFVQRTELLLVNKHQRREQGHVLRNRVLAHHTGDGWLRHLEALYAATDQLRHTPAAIAETRCADGEGDIGLTLRNFYSDERIQDLTPGTALTAAVLRYGVQIAGEAGAFATARRLAMRAVLLQPFSRDAWRALTLALLGHTAKFAIALVQLRWSAQSLGFGAPR